MSLPPPPLSVDRVNTLIRYHELVLRELAGRRTNLTSGLIPVREYIILSNIESWHRWPEILVQVDDAMGAEEVGRRTCSTSSASASSHPTAREPVPRDAADFVPFLELLPPSDEIGDEPIFSLFPT